MPVEAFSNIPSSNGFAALQPVSPVEQQLFETYDTQGSYPFIDVGNAYTSWYSTVLPQKVAGMNWTQIVRFADAPQQRRRAGGCG